MQLLWCIKLTISNSWATSSIFWNQSISRRNLIEESAEVGACIWSGKNKLCYIGSGILVANLPYKAGSFFLSWGNPFAFPLVMKWEFDLGNLAKQV